MLYQREGSRERGFSTRHKEEEMTMGRIKEWMRRLPERSGGIMVRINWRIVLAVGVAVAVLSLLYHTWKFMSLRGL